MQSTLQILNCSLPKTIIFQEVLGFSVQNPKSQNIVTDGLNNIMNHLVTVNGGFYIWYPKIIWNSYEIYCRMVFICQT